MWCGINTVVVTGAAGSLGRKVTASLATRAIVDRVLAVDMVPMPATAPQVEVHAFDLSAPARLTSWPRWPSKRTPWCTWPGSHREKAT